MSEPKWTKGEWTSHPDDQGSAGGDCYVCVVDEEQKVVARVNCYDRVTLNRIPYEANAHLIASAPTLYQELAEMVELFHGYQGMELTRAKAALAKARGES